MNMLVWVFFWKNNSHVEKSGLLIVETVFHFGMIHKEYVDKRQTMLILHKYAPATKFFREIS